MPSVELNIILELLVGDGGPLENVASGWIDFGDPEEGGGGESRDAGLENLKMGLHHREEGEML